MDTKEPRRLPARDEGKGDLSVVNGIRPPVAGAGDAASRVVAGKVVWALALPALRACLRSRRRGADIGQGFRFIIRLEGERVEAGST